MYIIAIAWAYVTILMAATEKSITAGILTFVFYGLIPCGLLLWILGTKHRKSKHYQRQKNVDSSLQQHMREPNSTDAEANQ